MSEATDALLMLEPLLGWIQAEPDAAPDRELELAATHFQALARLDLPPERVLGLLDLFYGRVFDLAGRFRARLMGCGLPLSRHLHLPLRRLVRLCGDLAAAYFGVARALAADLTRTQRLGDQSLGAHAMDLVSEAWVVAAMGGMSAPFELWGTAHSLFLTLGGPSAEAGLLAAGRDDRTIRAYKRLMALAVIQQESFSAREIGWVADFLDETAGLTRLEALEEGCTSGYWIDPAQDAPPVALARRRPPPVEGLLHLATDPLARLLTERLERLDGGLDEEPADVVDEVVAVTVQADLPQGLAARELVVLMRRLRESWAMPPLRELPRRRRQDAAEVCLGLRSIWELFQHGQTEADISDWVVLNESPGGYALMSTGDVSGALHAGMALALRRHGEPRWSLGVVRWIRTENPSEVELGLQVVAVGATPVRLGFRSGQVREMVHGLLLAPMGEVRRHQAIMAPAGTHSSRRFVYVHEGLDRLYVAQGRLLSLDVQTAGVELFQFELDPYPI
jgi:hypothetical protein